MVLLWRCDCFIWILAALFDTHVVRVGLLYSILGPVCILVYTGVYWVYAVDAQTSSVSMAGMTSDQNNPMTPITHIGVNFTMKPPVKSTENVPIHTYMMQWST